MGNVMGSHGVLCFMKKIPILFLVSLFCSCSESRTPIPEHRIVGRSLSLPEDAALNYSGLYLNESEHCIIKSEYQGEIALKKIFYDADSVACVFRRGRGPKEFMDINVVHVDPQGGFYATVDATGRILRFSSDGEPIETFRLAFGMLAATVVGDLFVSYGAESSVYQLWNRSGEKLAEFGTLPDDGIACGDNYKTMAYQGILLAHPDRKRFAHLCSFAKMFDIYEIDSLCNPANVFSLRANLPVYSPQRQVRGVRYEKFEIGYSSAYATGRFIYAQYSGKRPGDDHSAKTVREAFENDRIEVYDWDGAHRCDLLLDRPILDFCVGSDDGFLIALYSDEGEMRFCRYDLAGIGIR